MDSFSFQKSGVLEIYWLCSIGSYLWGKRHNLWSEVPKYFGNKAHTKLQIDVRGNNNLYKICFDIYCTFYIYAFH